MILSARSNKSGWRQAPGVVCDLRGMQHCCLGTGCGRYETFDVKGYFVGDKYADKFVHQLYSGEGCSIPALANGSTQVRHASSDNTLVSTFSHFDNLDIPQEYTPWAIPYMLKAEIVDDARKPSVFGYTEPKLEVKKPRQPSEVLSVHGSDSEGDPDNDSGVAGVSTNTRDRLIPASTAVALLCAVHSWAVAAHRRKTWARISRGRESGKTSASKGGHWRLGHRIGSRICGGRMRVVAECWPVAKDQVLGVESQCGMFCGQHSRSVTARKRHRASGGKLSDEGEDFFDEAEGDDTISDGGSEGELPGNMADYEGAETATTAFTRRR